MTRFGKLERDASCRGVYQASLSLNYPTLDRYQVETPRFPFGALNCRRGTTSRKRWAMRELQGG